MSPFESPDADGTSRDTRAVRCPACRSALDDLGQQGLSFMLLDGLTIPLVGCDRHLEQFTTACGLTSTETVTHLTHRPAGGIHCPACRLSVHEPGYPLVPVGEGAVMILGCERHQAEALGRFSSGSKTQQRLTADFGSIN